MCSVPFQAVRTRRTKPVAPLLSRGFLPSSWVRTKQRNRLLTVVRRRDMPCGVRGWKGTGLMFVYTVGVGGSLLMRCHSKQTGTGSEGASQRGVRTERAADAERLRGQGGVPASLEGSKEATVASARPAESEGTHSSGAAGGSGQCKDVAFPSGRERKPPGVASRGLG